MSVKIGIDGHANVNIGVHGKDSFGLPVESGNISPRKEDDKSVPQTPLGKVTVCSGVKVPLLKDLGGRYVSKESPSCRFDIVEKVLTVIKPGSYGPSENLKSMGGIKTAAEGTDAGQGRLFVSRQPTFHSTATRTSDHKDIWEKISPYHWNQWQMNRKDARDVLYRNTYCLGKEELRYRSLTLPRISQERPWTVADMPTKEKVYPEHGESSKTIIAQQPRGTVVRFREYMRPYVHESEGNSLEIKRFNDRVKRNHFTTVSNGFPFIRHDSRQTSRKSERPMKFENSRYAKNAKGTLFNKHIVPVPYNGIFDRDYSSADTFKQYLDSLKNNTAGNMAGVYMRDRNPHSRQSMDYHNQVLQSVTEVNQPEMCDPMEPPVTENHSRTHEARSLITVEIKPSWKENDCDDPNAGSIHSQKHGQRAPTIDNLSSVHGSLVRSNPQAVAMPISSSVVETGSVVKAPGVPGAGVPSPNQGASSESGATCPVNTPTPDEEFVD